MVSSISKFIRSVDQLTAGKLYNTIRSERISLYENPHNHHDSYLLNHSGFLDPEECFVFLEYKLIFKTYYCLRILTTSGQIGWSAELHLNKRYESITFEELK